MRGPKAKRRGRSTDSRAFRWDSALVIQITTRDEGGAEMSATASNRRELARRLSDGIDVTLLWNEGTSRVTVQVLDTHSGEALQFQVDGSAALDAFRHPYAYAAAQRAGSVTKSSVAVSR
jgi:hypothetical protein